MRLPSPSGLPGLMSVSDLMGKFFFLGFRVPVVLEGGRAGGSVGAVGAMRCLDGWMDGGMEWLHGWFACRKGRGGRQVVLIVCGVGDGGGVGMEMRGG